MTLALPSRRLPPQWVRNDLWRRARAVPSLDLQFADRKSLVDGISGQNLITFTRASSGTYFDQNGVLQTAPAGVARFDHDPETGESLGLLVEEARTNFWTYSLNPTQKSVANTACTLDGSTLDPLGNVSGKVTATIVNTYQLWRQTGFNLTSGVYCFSVYLKAGNIGSSIYLSAGGNSPNAIFNVISGSIVSTTDCTAKIKNAGNGWYHCSIIWTAINTTEIRTWTLNEAVGGYYYVSSPQVEAGSFPTSYIPTPATFTSRSTTATYYDANGVIQTAAINVARDNAYFPDENGVMRPAGLLLEAAGTNLLTYSEQFDNAFWLKRNGAIVTANAVAAPDGTTTADELIHPGGTTYARIETSPGISVTTGNQYTASVFAKFKAGSEANVLAIQFQNASGFIYVNLSTKAVLSGSGVSIQSLSNGWLRVSWTFTATVTGTGQLYLYPTNTTNTAPNPSIAANSGLYIWGAQLEASPYPTSYIPTSGSAVTRAADVSTSAAVTRSADVAQITGSNFSSWFNPNSSSILTEYKTSRSGWYVPVYSLHSNINANKGFYLQGYNNNSWNPYLVDLGNGYFSTTGGGPFSGDNKVSISLETGSFRMAQNGAMNVGVASSSITGPFSNVTRFRFAVSSATNSTLGSITFSRLSYWPIRLPDATLQALTSS